MKKLTNDEVILKLLNLYGDSLDYSKVDYIDSRSYITLICPIHGEFEQYANNALQGKGGCPKCKLGISSQKEFIDAAISIFGTKFSYEKTNFINLSTKVTITCPIHGDFDIVPRHFLKSKYGCAKCRYNNRTSTDKKPKKSILDKQQVWIEFCNDKHSNKYDYSKVEYINSKTKVCIICPKHGEFWQTPQDHKLGKGCPLCGREKVSSKQRLTQDEFEARARSVHGDRYTYTKYISMHTNMEIICPEHGPFMCSPRNHINGCGCPICSQSVGENIINGWLTSNNIEFNRQKKYTINDNVVYVDFYIKTKNHEYIIEYNGIQHYVPVEFFGGELKFRKLCERDQSLRTYCLNNDIILLEIPYTESKSSISKLLNNLFYGKI